MTIFDNIPRDDTQPPLKDETQFAYLNRSGRTDAARVRDKVDAWFAAYPEAHRVPLVARFRSSISDQHRSAFFELLLYHLLLARGCNVLAIEPVLAHTDASPDFLVEDAASQRFYVEAVQVSGLSNPEVSAQARLNTALSAIDGMSSPHHFLDLKVTGSPAKPLSVKKLKSTLRSWIAGLPFDETARLTAPFVWDEHGCKIQLTAWSRNKPDEKGRAIGVQRSSFVRADPSQDVRPALKKKASRYCELDHPYLVALNALSKHHSEGAVIDALFGTPQLRLTKGIAEETVDYPRQPDGVWYGPPDGQPQNTRLSAVLVLMKIDPWNFANKSGLFIPNPWAKRPLPNPNLGTTEFALVGERFKRKDGKSLCELLGISANWPDDH